MQKERKKQLTILNPNRSRIILPALNNRKPHLLQILPLNPRPLRQPLPHLLESLTILQRENERRAVRFAGFLLEVETVEESAIRLFAAPPSSPSLLPPRLSSLSSAGMCFGGDALGVHGHEFVEADDWVRGREDLVDFVAVGLVEADLLQDLIG